MHLRRVPTHTRHYNFLFLEIFVSILRLFIDEAVWIMTLTTRAPSRVSLRMKLAVSALAAVVLSGCAGTIPVTYVPQNFARYEGVVDIGQFTYAPAANGKIAPNQLQNTAAGQVFVGTDVAQLVQRATALELEKTGFKLGMEYPLVVSGEVMQFLIDDLGYSVDWSYSVRYVISDKSTKDELLSKVYEADKKRTGKFGLAADFSPSVNEMILSAYDKFIRDPEVRALLAVK